MTDATDTTAHIEGRIIDACADIRSTWPKMLDAFTSARRGSGETSSDEVTALDRILSERVDATIIINSWCRLVMEDRPVTTALPRGEDVLDMLTFLNRHARWLSGHEAAGDAVIELEAIAQTCECIVAPRQREWILIGTCPLVTDDTTCGGRVRAWPGTLHVEDDGAIRTREQLPLVERLKLPPERMPSCETCGVEGDVRWWEQQMFPGEAARALVTADELPTILHKTQGIVVKPSTLRQWIKRGVIASAGRDEQGRTLYDRAAVAWALGVRETARHG